MVIAKFGRKIHFCIAKKIPRIFKSALRKQSLIEYSLDEYYEIILSCIGDNSNHHKRGRKKLSFFKSTRIMFVLT